MLLFSMRYTYDISNVLTSSFTCIFVHKKAKKIIIDSDFYWF